MGSFFSKKKTVSRVSEHDKVVLQLKTQRDNIKRQQMRIEQTLEKDRLLAKQLLADGKRERAKLLLKKKRYQEQMLHNADQQLQNLEKMVDDLEFAAIEVKVVDGLKLGNSALKKINEALNIEDIERILEETREGVEKQQEISELISGALTDEDNAAVEEELADMIAKEEANLVLPSVPAAEPEEGVSEMEAKKSKPARERVALEA